MAYENISDKQLQKPDPSVREGSSGVLQPPLHHNAAGTLPDLGGWGVRGQKGVAAKHLRMRFLHAKDIFHAWD